MQHLPDPTSALNSEQPSPKYPGIWIDGDIRRLAAEGTITRTEGELLGHIANYSKSGEGCWTSKKEYSRLLGVTTQWVRKMILQLLELGLIYQDGVVKHGRAVKPVYQLNGDSALFKRSRGKPQLAGRGKPGFAPIKDSASQNLITSIPAGSPAGKHRGDVKETTPVGFIPELEAPSGRKQLPSQEDTSDAQKLLEALQKKKGLRARVSVKAWANEFRLLKAGYPPSDVRQTLNWYAEHLTDKYVPLAHCAKTFRAKYLKIVDAMARSVSAPAKVEDVVISPEAKTIASENGSWGRKTTEAFVQVTFNNVKAYRKQLRLYAEANKGKASARFALDLRESLGRDNAEIWLTVEDWLGHTISWTNAVEFKGNVMAHAFLDTKVRDQYLDRLVRKEGHDAKAYALLKSRLEATP